MYQAYLGGDDTIPYDALSYTWGGTHKTSTVKVNGNYLDVTENLYLALRHLRSEDIDRVIWVDAICINQSNEQERGHQVQHMCKIYSQAEEVVVWLGQATQETDILMDALQRLDEYNSSHSNKDNHRDLEQWDTFWLFVSEDSYFERRKCLDQLLSRPWFKRVWILQEIANAKRASILCGTKSIRAHTLALAPSLMNIKPERHCQAVLDIMPGRLREQTWWSKSRSLYNLLQKFIESEASDPRDKVYALLGISSDAQDTNGLHPDYKKSLHEVIQDTSSFLFGPSDSSYGPMPEFLVNLTSLDVASFVELAKMSDVSGVNLFLKRRGLDVSLSEDVIKAAASNEGNGLEILKLFLREREKEFKVTKGLIEAAVGNETNGSDIMDLLFHECESKIRLVVVRELLETDYKNYKEIVKPLIRSTLEEFPRFEVRNTIEDIVLVASPEKFRTAVEMLLFDTASKAAADERHEAVLRLLLERSADGLLLYNRRSFVDWHR
jgi:hypothetical protein